MVKNLLFIGGPADGRFACMNVIEHGQIVTVPAGYNGLGFPRISSPAISSRSSDTYYRCHQLTADGADHWVAVPEDQGMMAAGYIMTRLLNRYGSGEKVGDDTADSASEIARLKQRIAFLEENAQGSIDRAAAEEKHRIDMFQQLVRVVEAAGGEVRVDFDVAVIAPELRLYREEDHDGNLTYRTRRQGKGTN